MNNLNGREIVEDAPQMRSMAIAPPQMPSVRTFSSPAQKMPSPDALGGSFASSKRQIDTKDASNSSTSGRMADSFPSIPSGYFMERTHVQIGDASPQEVLNRVSACLQKESVASNFESEEVLITCKTECHLEFNVNFFKSQQDDLIVEVQRCSGCSFMFHQMSRAVLRAAKDMPPAPQRKRLALPSSIPRQTDFELKCCIEDGINTAAALMKQGTLDAKLMGVESLAHIAGNKAGEGLGSEQIMANKEILEQLLAFMSHGSADVDSNWDFDQGKVCRAALTTLASCLEQLKSNGKLQRYLGMHLDTLVGDKVLCALLEYVSSSDEKPHEACQALRALHSLSYASVGTRRRVKELNVDAVVARAHKEGMQRHAILQDLSKNYQTFMRAGDVV